MLRLADIVRRHGEQYRAQHGARLLPSHARALFDLEHCRTARLGGHLARCTQCEAEHVVHHSCRNRACPRCGHDATARWLEGQRELLLPVAYFHVVFTLPAELRRLLRAHQRALLPVLFRSAFDALAMLAADPKFLGADIGALAVLHTWTRTLEWHPHVHLLVPGGGLADDGATWRTPPHRKVPFLVPIKPLAKLFRALFLRRARRALARSGATLPDIPWNKSWVVFAKPAVQGADRVLEYLGRYVHRTALGENALLASDERGVTFRYRDSRDQRHKMMTLPGPEFLRRFLQHVPPKGFHRVRAFGLLHPHQRTELKAAAIDARQQDHRRCRRERTSTSPAGAPLQALWSAVVTFASTALVRRMPRSRRRVESNTVSDHCCRARSARVGRRRHPMGGVVSAATSRPLSIALPQAKVCARSRSVDEFGAASAGPRLQNPLLVDGGLPRARATPLGAVHHVSRNDSKPQ